MRTLAADVRAGLIGWGIGALANLGGASPEPIASAPVETCSAGSVRGAQLDAPIVPAVGQTGLPPATGPASVGTGMRYELVRFVWAPDGALVFVEAIVVVPPPGSPGAPLPDDAVPPDVLPLPG